MATPHTDLTVRMGGAALVAAARGFMGVFTYLAVRFNYPDVLDAPAAEALPALLAMGGEAELCRAGSPASVSWPESSGGSPCGVT
jgi:hypothetical protein